MLKPFVILFLLVVVVISSACHHSAPTPSCPFESWKLCPPAEWQCNCSVSSSDEYDSSKLLDLLLQYKPFADFYDNEIKPLDYTIRYFYNPDLLPGNAQTLVDTQNHTARVELGNIAGNDDFAFIIAHELASITTAIKGYLPSNLGLQSTGQCQELAGDMYDMIDTPFRDSILAHYGFNVEREFYAWRVPSLYSEYEGNDTISTLINAVDYVELVLYWQDVLGNHDVPTILDCWYQECRPDVGVEGKDILAIVRQSGYDTPQKVAVLFQEIIAKYDLAKDCIRLSP